jgi:hypothetical protein
MSKFKEFSAMHDQALDEITDIFGKYHMESSEGQRNALIEISDTLRTLITDVSLCAVRDK